MALGVPRETEALVIDGGSPQSIPKVEKIEREKGEKIGKEEILLLLKT